LKRRAVDEPAISAVAGGKLMVRSRIPAVDC
jgi:hypothetical protein